MLLPPWSLHKIDKNRGIEWLSFFVYITSRQLSRYWGRYMLTPPVFMSSCEVEKNRSLTVPILSDLQSKLLIFSIFSPFIRESVRIWIQFVRSKKSMIGIVKFPVEVFLTKELQLFVWNERLKSIICIRVLLQKKRGELVIDEVFTKVVCWGKKVSMKRHVSSFETLHRLHSKWWPGRKSVWVKKSVKKWAVHVFCKVPVKKRGRF